MTDRPIVCVDVDGTLFNHDGSVNEHIVNVIKALHRYCTIYVWSGGGKDYAEQRVRDAKIGEWVNDTLSKMEVSKIGRPDITFDDAEYLFGKVNVRV